MPTLLYEELQDILSKTKYSKPDIFVETGTYEAETTLRMANYFEQVFTIEISESLFRECREKCKNNYNIVNIFGDSAKRLPYLVSTIKDPVIFWLDGHWSRGKTAAGDKDVPILEEVDAIYQYFEGSAILIIDDLRLFGGYVDVDWSDITIDNIKSRLGERIYNEFFLGDRYIIELTKKGSYSGENDDVKYEVIADLVSNIMSVVMPCGGGEDDSYHLDYCGICNYCSYNDLYNDIYDTIMQSDLVKDVIIYK